MQKYKKECLAAERRHLSEVNQMFNRLNVFCEDMHRLLRPVQFLLTQDDSSASSRLQNELRDSKKNISRNWPEMKTNRGYVDKVPHGNPLKLNLFVPMRDRESGRCKDSIENVFRNIFGRRMGVNFEISVGKTAGWANRLNTESGERIPTIKIKESWFHKVYRKKLASNKQSQHISWVTLDAGKPTCRELINPFDDLEVIGEITTTPVTILKGRTGHRRHSLFESLKTEAGFIHEVVFKTKFRLHQKLANGSDHVSDYKIMHFCKTADGSKAMASRLSKLLRQYFKNYKEDHVNSVIGVLGRKLFQPEEIPYLSKCLTEHEAFIAMTKATKLIK